MPANLRCRWRDGTTVGPWGSVPVILATLTVIVSGCGATTSRSAASASVPSLSAAATSSAEAGVGFGLVATYSDAEIPGLEVPGYLAVGPDELLYMTNGEHEILVLDAHAEVVDRFGELGSDLGQFNFRRRQGDAESDLGAIAFAEDGTVFVVEGGNKRVQRFDSEWAPELTWGTEGDGPGAFLDPIGIAVSAAGEVFVVDDVRNDIQVFSSDGDYLRTIGGPGSADGELGDTGNIRIAEDGSLVNADFGNGRVQAWDAEGVFAWTLGSRGTGPGEFTEPQDVAFGPSDEMFVVDDSRVQVFDAEMQLIGSWPEPPSTEHLGSIAVIGTTLWVLAPYAGLYEVELSDLAGTP